MIEHGVCYLTLCDKGFPKRLAFLYLEEVHGEFVVRTTVTVKGVLHAEEIYTNQLGHMFDCASEFPQLILSPHLSFFLLSTLFGRGGLVGGRAGRVAWG
jgi:hypothetical protein